MASVDAAWLGMEDPTNLMMVTGVLVLDGKVDLKRLKTLLDKRLAPFGRFHQRVVRPRTRAGLPHWQDEVGFSIDNHVSHVALPGPGGEKALRELVSELMSTPLDMTKPMWHVHLIDGHDHGSVVLARNNHSGPLDSLPATISRGFAATQRLLDNPGRVADLARLGAASAYRLGRLVVLPPDPVTAFKGELGRRKRAAWSDPVPLDDFKAIGKAY